jgi:hypothetical protein
LFDALKFQRMVGGDSGSCFGVTDPSRLRPALHPTESVPPLLCEGCRESGEHNCEKNLKVIWGRSNGTGGGKISTFEIPCECPSCNK